MKKTFTFLISVFTVWLITAQKADHSWSVSYAPQKVFIENKSQFNGNNHLPGSEILFGTEYSSSQFLFTKQGLTYRLTKKEFPGKEEREEREKEMKEEIRNGKKISHKEMEEEEHRIEIETEYVHMYWKNSNPDVEIVAQGVVPNYFNYGLGNTSINAVKAYKKLIYKNLYPNIDVEYVFHPENGIEYSFILHPGADASQIKMTYTGAEAISLDAQKNIHLATELGDIVDHAPHTFYSDNPNNLITSRFFRNGNTVSFVLENYDRTKQVTIDPWTQTPTFNTQWDCVWECEKDGAGNVYLIGGVMPMQLLKYNSAGALQWTYSTPYDTTSWLGTFATDDAGNSYVTQGSVAAIQKINTAGALVWNNGNPGGIFASTEFWSISFNCDQTKLVIGGTGNTLPPLPYIYQVDMATGNVNTSVQITGGALFPTQEVRSITACGNGKYYFLTHDSIGYINQNLSLCPNPSQAKFYTDNGYGLGYKCENFRYNNTGIAALKYYGGFIFSHRGNQLHKRDFTTGAILATATIPGGAYTTQFGSSFVENSGIDIDNCGNIYVGSKNQVVKFDQNLNQLATYATSVNFNVYDVHVNTSGEIIAGGSTGNSGSGARSGYIQSISAGACSPTAITCCDASFCNVGPFCSTDAAVNLTAASAGTWSGPGIVGNTFSPSVAGPGQHYIKHTIGCGSDSLLVNVNICAALQVCLESNGNLTVSNGTAPYTWQSQSTAQDCSSCILGCAFPPGCATTTTIWTTYATGATATPPGTWPIRVNDNSANTLTVTSTASLPSCAACSLTATATSTSATCGNNNGTATAIPTGGTATGYNWSSGASTATASNLAAGTYTVTVIAGGCNATATVTVGSTPGITISTSSTNAGCTTNGSATATVNSGTATGYAWSNGGTTATISAAAGTYTVTVTGTGGCTATSSVVVNSSASGISLSSSTTSATCGSSNGSATVVVTSGTATGYSWSTGATTSTISNLAAGNYTVTVTGSGGCSATTTAVVSNTGAVTLSTTSQDASCGAANGSASVSVVSGTATGYLWSNGATSATATSLSSGSYTVTVTGNGGCTTTASVVVNEIGGITISSNSTNTSCGNNNGSASVTVLSGTATGYLWSNGATNSSISNLSSGIYTVTVSGNGGCSATASVTINPSGNSPVTITSDKNLMCSGDSAHVCAPSGYPAYLWNTGQSGQCIYTQLAGNYYVTVTDIGNCTATSNHIGISVYPLPPVSISVNGDTMKVYNAVSQQWFYNNNPIPGATGTVYIANQSGNYAVAVTDTNGCVALSNPVVMVISGLSDLTTNDDINIYPNPLEAGNWHLDVSKGLIGGKVEVYDNNGRLVYRSEIKNQKSEIVLNVESGIYLMKVSNDSKNLTRKLIKL